MADPAFRGFVESTLDALLVFEGCKRGYLPKISRRLQEYEKKALVKSGAIFVFDEEETGIKRWTDGLSWSPSRTLGNFLVYRELDKKGGTSSSNKEEEEDPSDKSTAPSNSSSRLMGGLTSKSDPLDDANDLAPVPSTSSNRLPNAAPRQRSLSEVAGVLQLDRARERALVGSLTSSYRFRSDGLVKKTISLSGLHLVAYYRLDDVTCGRLRTPSSHAELMSLEVSPGFLTPSLFRLPPVVEVGLDGQIRYKGESDTPISPLTRSGSSQGFPTPNPNPNQSRPTTSDPYTSTTPSHLTPNLNPRPPSRDYSAAPGSPRRGATATARSANRFDPYGARYSPNASSYSSTSSYPFNHQVPPSQPSPNRSTFSPIGETTAEFHRRDSSNEGRMIGNSSNSAGSLQGIWYGQDQNQSYHTLQGGGPGGSGPVGRATYGSESSSGHYKRQHSIPYTPSASNGIATPSSTAVFNFNPPSAAPPAPGPPLRRASDYAQRPPQSTLPARPVSQQHRPSSMQRSPSFNQYTNPSNGYAGSTYQSHHHLPRDSPAPAPAPSPPNWNPLEFASNSQAAASLDHSQNQNVRSALHSSIYHPASVAPASESTYSYEAVNQPNGLVVGYQEKQPTADALGLYQTDPVYEQPPPPPPSSSATNGRPAPYRQIPESQYAPSSQTSSFSSHNAYPSVSATASTVGSSEPINSYGLATYSNDRDGWQQKPVPNEAASFNGQASTGWWNPGSQDCTAEAFWQAQMVKKEYS
ncbi:hypothetical protein JCM3765_005661 [Sporobolomyces pararoseus]